MSADRDRSNYLTKDEIIDVVRHFALPIPLNHIDDVFQIVDTNNDGKISYVEFCAKLKPFDSK